MRVFRDLRDAYVHDLDAAARGAFTGWLAFTLTFAGVRLITHAIRDGGRGPFHNVSAGGIHLHHYLWGILGLTLVGAVAVRGNTAAVQHPVVATLYGASLALIVDEFALLLDLRDVYWQKEGRLSVHLAATVIGVVGVYFTAIPLARHYLHRRRIPG